ncbi:MAG: glycosyltransferase family 39 protein [Ardenticatenaceae bacterium]|nr:glycosyltransferase family 39 protein [Ardenticatenaceae bacterium]
MLYESSRLIPREGGPFDIGRSAAIVLLLLLLTAGFLIRLVAAKHTETGSLTGWTEHGVVGRNVAEGRGFTYDFYGERANAPLQSFVPPLFPGLVVLCLMLFPDPRHGFALIQIGFTVTNIILLFGIGYSLSERHLVGLFAAAAGAFYPVYVALVTTPNTTLLHSTLILLLTVNMIRLQRQPSLVRALVLGGTIGLAALAKPFLVALLLPAGVALYLEGFPWRRVAGLSLLAGAATVLVLLPWTVRNYRIHGELFLVSTNGGITFWNGNNSFSTGSGQEVYTEAAYRYLGQTPPPNAPPIMRMRLYPLPPEVQAHLSELSEVELDRRLFRASLDFARENPRAWFALLKQKAIGFVWFRPNIGSAYDKTTWTEVYRWVYGALLLLAIPGMMVALKRWRLFFPLYSVLLLQIAVHVLSNIQTRYRWEVESLLFIFAAVALVTALNLVTAKKRVKVATLYPLA